MSEKQGLRKRAVRRAVEVAGGDLLQQLRERITALEAEVQENRQLNVRVAELVDLVQELLLPVASQDQEKIKAATEKFSRSL